MKTLSELFGPGGESQHYPQPVGRPDESSYEPEQGVHRGMTVVLPEHIHKFVHDPRQPAPAKAHLLLSEVRKQIAKNEGPEGEEGSAGGLGNYWTPSPHKAAEYASQGFQPYKRHELEHNCGDPETGSGGCPTTQVVVHADTPPDKHHWTEQYRPGEKYDPQISWRLPVRPGAPLGIRGVSWRQGTDHWDFHRKYSPEGSAHHTDTPFTRYDFSSTVKKQASQGVHGMEIPSDFLKLHGRSVTVDTEGSPHVEMVPTYDVAKHATQEVDGQHAKKVAEHFLTEGSMKPLILQYHPKSGEAYLGEGNHRLYAARKLGMTHVPVRVSRNNYGLSGTGAPVPQNHPAVDAGTHVPSEMRPSELGFDTLAPRAPRTAGVTMGMPGPMGEDHYDEDEGEHKQLWDQWHPQLQPEVHRHLAVDLPGSHPAHNEKLPMEERARAVLQHVISHGNVGHHWTDDPSYKFMSGSRIEPGQTHVTLHAKTPPRSHIEDNSWTLRDDRAVFDWDSHPEREVPMKRNAPLELSGVSWHTPKGPVRHDFGHPIRVHANIIEVREKAREKREQHGACPNASCGAWRGHGGNCWYGGWGTGYGTGWGTPPADTGAGEGDVGGDMGAEASRTASYVPPSTMGKDSEGHQVQMTTMDGWAHADGSHGHEDNTTIGDKPVYTQDHTWLPEGRYWGPNSAQNDQRLFEGDHLRPEVRQDILDRINGVFRPRYKQWPKWTMVYFAGSEAAKWQPFNGDFDILIGIDWGKFRSDNPGYQDKTDAQVATEMTDDLWQHANVDGYWFDLKDGRKVGPFDRTFFVNPEAYDIRRLHPYAAYNVTKDTWAVHPLEVPGDWDATHLPEAYWGYAESLLNEVKAIGVLPPEERHRMAANLYEELHNHRSDAFGEEGKGLFDLSNVVEKYLDQHPDKPWDKLKKWKSESPSGPQPWVPTTARRTTLTALFSEAKEKPKGADTDGIMIAIVPPEKVGKKLLVEDGEPLEALHVTLAYLGSSGDHSKDQVKDLPSLVEAWARTQKPFGAKVGGAGTFTNPGQHVLWAAVDIPGGGGIRHSLSELLEEHGYKVRNDHGWTPHITLKYHTSHVRFLPKIEPMSWDVEEIMLCIGGDWSPIKLGS